MYIESLEKPGDPLIAALLNKSIQNYGSIMKIEKELGDFNVANNLSVAATQINAGNRDDGQQEALSHQNMKQQPENFFDQNVIVQHTGQQEVSTI